MELNAIQNRTKPTTYIMSDWQQGPSSGTISLEMGPSFAHGQRRYVAGGIIRKGSAELGLKNTPAVNNPGQVCSRLYGKRLYCTTPIFWPGSACSGLSLVGPPGIRTASPKIMIFGVNY
jgi:hypothetical protein